MKHRKPKRKLNVTSAHRKAMFRNMATSLIIHERIKTTLPKAKELRSYIARVIGFAKRGDLHSRRLAAGYLFGKEALKKAFEELGPRYRDIPGGYTRIIKVGYRRGDNAQMAIIEFVKPEEKEEAKEEGQKATK